MNGKEHATIGVIAACGVGVFLSYQTQHQPSVAEICGWAAGGLLGAKLPDVFEPAIHPRHRKFCHRGTVLASELAVMQSANLRRWIENLRDEATRHRTKALIDPNAASSHLLAALFLEFLVGLLPGLISGYASHLIADCTTPCGIPSI